MLINAAFNGSELVLIFYFNPLVLDIQWNFYELKVMLFITIPAFISNWEVILANYPISVISILEHIPSLALALALAP